LICHGDQSDRTIPLFPDVGAGLARVVTLIYIAAYLPDADVAARYAEQMQPNTPPSKSEPHAAAAGAARGTRGAAGSNCAATLRC
jgi:hypothetical protein